MRVHVCLEMTDSQRTVFALMLHWHESKQMIQSRAKAQQGTQTSSFNPYEEWHRIVETRKGQVRGGRNNPVKPRKVTDRCTAGGNDTSFFFFLI